MHPRIIITAGAAGLCLATLGTALPASAAPSTSPVDQSSTSSPVKAIAAPTASLKGITPTTATVTIGGGAAGATIRITDGDSIDLTRRVFVPGATLTIPVPVAAGQHYELRVTQTANGETSEPATVEVDTAISTLAPLHSLSAIPAAGNGVVKLTGTPFVEAEVTNIYGKVIGTGFAKADGSAVIGYKGTWDLTDQRLFVRQAFGDVTSPTVEVRVGDSDPTDDPKAITIDVSEDGGFTVLKATADTTGTAVNQLLVRDGEHKQIASALFSNGSATVVLPTPKNAQLLNVSGRTGNVNDGPQRETKAVAVTLKDDLGSVKPEAPVVDDVHMSGSSAVATVDAAPNGIVTVKDAQDRVVAMRATGTSAKASLRIPEATAGSEYVVTQSTGSLSSDPTSFTVQ